jgi:hypothetical protein
VAARRLIGLVIPELPDVLGGPVEASGPVVSSAALIQGKKMFATKSPLRRYRRGHNLEQFRTS